MGIVIFATSYGIHFHICFTLNFEMGRYWLDMEGM